MTWNSLSTSRISWRSASSAALWAPEDKLDRVGQWSKDIALTLFHRYGGGALKLETVISRNKRSI